MQHLLPVLPHNRSRRIEWLVADGWGAESSGRLRPESSRGDVARRRYCLAPGGGLIFPGEKGVHTHFMRFPIDVVFYDRGLAVLDVVEALAPWRFSPYRWRARGLVELPAGTARATGTRPGDQLTVA